ncbi:MAG TPA: response regulator [Candidatus Binatia bacterium]|jgi:signal transduction histidine kinase|nr:response regulator [Candidatus Binatia bacterium]
MRDETNSRILVVDDTDALRYRKVRILRQEGFDVSEAATGTEALQMVTERQPHLVLLDIKLPDVSGWEVCRRLKADAATSSVMVLQLSATYTDATATARALDGGADAYLTEPAEPPVLLATVRALLRLRHAEDELRVALHREQAARQEAEAANRSKDEFLATLSHELRSPLSAILTWITLLRHDDSPARVKHAIEVVERNARSQARLIEDLLDISRIIAGKMRLDVRPLNLRGVVETALETIRASANQRGVELRLVAGAEFPSSRGDAPRLQQVVLNLLSNAVKFTPSGGVVTVSLERRDDQASITVRDTGSGIAADFIPHIFERFRQADGSSTRSQGGLGIGLAIVRHLVELHGGTVRAESAGIDAGTTFTVTLPLSDPSDEGISPPSAGLLPGAPNELTPLDGIRILVVEDHDDARDAIVAVLRQCGAEVTAARSVADARTVLAQVTPDIVISDIAMPSEDGYALIEHVRSNPATETVPAIALTAYAGGIEQARALAAGFEAHIAKPVEAAALARVVHSLARRRVP